MSITSNRGKMGIKLQKKVDNCIVSKDGNSFDAESNLYNNHHVK